MYVLFNSSNLDSMYHLCNPDLLFKDSKSKRRVSKYKDESGEIKEQIEYCENWVRNNFPKYLYTCKKIALRKLFKFVKSRGFNSKAYRSFKNEYNYNFEKNINFYEFLLIKFIRSDMSKIIKFNSYKMYRVRTIKLKYDIQEAVKLPISNYNIKHKETSLCNGFIEIPSSVYRKEDVVRFLLILDYALKEGKIYEILDIPDVFYALRQIICVGLDYYFR